MQETRAVEDPTLWTALAGGRGEASAAGDVAEGEVALALKALRRHLGMDVAFVSEFLEGERVFRHVDAEPGRSPIRAGDRMAMEEGYCRQVVEGRLPELIPDTSRLPAALAIPATAAVQIGAHLSVPLRLADGRVYGTFCCFSFGPDASLGVRDLQMMKAISDVVAHRIEKDVAAERARALKERRIALALERAEPAILFQPIVRLADMRLAGAEALARFAMEPQRAPDQWFAEAGEVGRRSELELAALRNALALCAPVFARADVSLSLNSSPETLLSGALPALLGAHAPGRVVVEITEHEQIADYAALLAALAPLRAMGVRIAIDDVGSGYASMRHILNIRPDIIKLDISLTSGIEADPMKRSLAHALILFAEETGCRIIAEGIETDGALATLRALGVHAGQGYLLGRPMPLADLLALPPRQ